MVSFHLLGSFILIGTVWRSSRRIRVPIWGGGVAILTSPSSPSLGPFFQDEFGCGVERDADL